MTPLTVFEELRFVWELTAAELLFLIPFAQRKERFFLRAAMGLVVASAISMGYFLILELRAWLDFWLLQGVVCAWYIVLALLTIAYLRFCFRLTVHDALYMCIAGYAAQHIIYVSVHEVLALGLWPELTEHLLLYGVLALSACLLLYFLLYQLFSPRLRQCGGRMFEDEPGTIIATLMLLAVLMICSFAGQYIFQSGGQFGYVSAAVDVLCSVLILGIQYLSLRMAQTGREQAVIQQTLLDSERRFAVSRELIELANRSCHDLKHSLRAIQLAGEEERKEFIRSTEETIRLYQKYAPSGNLVVDALLAEKARHCEERQITLSCSAEAADLDFLSVTDLYALLGNAIDNAIECVETLPDPERRVVSLTIRRHHAFLSIQTNNYCPGAPSFQDGLPLTTKSGGLHGYGLKSIRYIVKKYGGSVQATVRDRVFILQIMLPIPGAGEG